MIATQQTALAETLAVQFNMNLWIAKKNLEGITNEESLIRAVPTGNHINWLTGHIVAVRCALLPALRQEPVWNEETLGLYRHGSSGAVDTDYLPFEEVVSAFYATQQRILDGIASLTEEDLAKPAPFSPGGGQDTFASLLTKSTVHEGYHLGQTGILRRVIGKEGAIK